MTRVIKISAKCSDAFYAELIVNGTQLGKEYDGYVPDFFPGEHYNDYVQLHIDIDTGKIVNWRIPPTDEIKHMFGIGKEKEDK